MAPSFTCDILPARSYSDEMERVFLWWQEVLLQCESIYEWLSPVPNQHRQTETKESKWDMPDELLVVLEKVEKGEHSTS
jgi:hypothetical protein